MKRMIMLLFISQFARAEFEPEVELFKNDAPKKIEEIKKEEKKEVEKPSNIDQKPHRNVQSSPKKPQKKEVFDEFEIGGREIVSRIVSFTEIKQERPLFVRIGDVAHIEILNSILAFPDEPTPVVGIVTKGQMKGSRIIGTARLEKNSKRVFIDFDKFSLGEITYTFKASAINATGSPGFDGIHHSQSAKLFTGEFISTMVSAYFDAQIKREKNAFGQTEIDNSVDSALKKGVSAGAMSTADRFRDRLKSTPEFSELKGPFRAKIIILDSAARL